MKRFSVRVKGENATLVKTRVGEWGDGFGVAHRGGSLTWGGKTELAFQGCAATYQ